MKANMEKKKEKYDYSVKLLNDTLVGKYTGIDEIIQDYDEEEIPNNVC